jgi:NADH-quinone oxidoreductase subunit N
MTLDFDLSRLAIFLPALGALGILGLDFFARPRSESGAQHRADALAGIRIGAVALVALFGVWLALRAESAADFDPNALFHLDAFAVFGIVFITLAGMLVLSLSLTHFGMARSRPAEPAALLLFSLTGMAAALASSHLLVIMIAIELAWLPMIALIAIDSRRLSSSESSLKAFFAHSFASVIFGLGIAFVFGATGRFDALALMDSEASDLLLWEVGVTLVMTGLIARAAIAPFHPWFPDVHEGAPSFVTTHVATAAMATTFFVLLRVVLLLTPEAESTVAGGDGAEFAERGASLLAALGCLGLLWGHSMALVQVGLRRLLGWLGVGQIGFFTLALANAREGGGEALLLGLVATAIATTGVLAILSSLSHHERACEYVGDLSGMMKRSPVRAALLSLFLLSLGGFPGTMGFVARLEILGAVEHGGRRWLLVAGLAATVLALTAVGRPLLAMLRPLETTRAPSRALTNEQLVLSICGICVLYFGFAPATGGENLASWLVDWIHTAVASLRL